MDAHHLKSDAAPIGVHLQAQAGHYHSDIPLAKDAKESSARIGRVVGRQFPWLIFVFGGLLSSWAAWNIGAQIEREASATFQIEAVNFQSAIASRLRSYEEVLFGLAGLYHWDKEVAPERFHAYAKSLDLETRFPALDGLNYAKYFTASERDQFLATFSREISERSDNPVLLNLPPNASEYMVITRTYPQGMPTLGMNLMTTAHRLSKDGLPALSSSLYRPHVPASSGAPVMVRPGASASLGVRLGVFNNAGDAGSRLTGTVGLIFNVEAFFKEAVPATLAGRVSYRVSTIGRASGEAYARPVSVYASTPSTPLRAHGPADLMSTAFTVPFGGAMLRVEMSEPISSLVGRRDKILPFAVLVGGLLFFGMAGVLSRRTLERNRELVQAITAQTADLQREIDRAKALERELAHVIEEERRRIGHELHDDLGQRLTGMSLSFKALSETLHSVSSDLSAQAEALERTTSEAISSVRGLAHGLMPVPAGRGGLSLALEQLASQVSSSQCVRCIFDFDDPVDIDNDTVATNLYRIAQEAVNNAIRHARATVVKIRLAEECGKISLSVEDNGIGFSHDRRSDECPAQLAGAGLRIMAYRASVINYRLAIHSSRGEGTTIKAQQC